MIEPTSESRNIDLEGIIQIGEIVNSHGIKGEVKVAPLTENPEIFEVLKELILILNNKREIYHVLRVREVKRFWLIKFDEVPDMNAAKLLKSHGIYIEQDKVRPLDEDEFFIHDLLHSKVYSTDNQYLGIITNYFEAGPQGVCEVSNGGESFLFPTTREVLKEIVAPDSVIINLLPGLRDIND